MVVSISPRLDNDPDIEVEEGQQIAVGSDPRFADDFRSLSLTSTEGLDHDYHRDSRAFASTPDPGARRSRKRQRESAGLLENVAPFSYRTRADGDAFRLAALQPGTGKAPIEASLLWDNSKSPHRQYRCLSYAWESVTRDAAILLDGYRYPITKNLLKALQNLRQPTTTLILWVDQICINQDDDSEREHQVSIMKDIFNRASKIHVWLGEADQKSEKLFEYARKIRRGEDSPKNALKHTLNQRELKSSIQNLLERPWFQRVWVIPEVALSSLTSVVCGPSHITWEILVRLVRDVQLPVASGFDKQTSLLGNPRQRIAIITQMIASQKSGLAHTDITQLLIIGKSSKATDVRDMVYAFYGVTLLRTFPDYSRSPERLFVDIVHMYTNSILWEASYASWHDLSAEQKAFQLMSIIYSAGLQHQHCTLPSWVPDWTFRWHLAPIWAKTTPNFATSSSKDEWSIGIRTDFRAGGNRIESFEVVEVSGGMHQLRISVWIFDQIMLVNEMTPASTPGSSQIVTGSPVLAGQDLSDLPALRYGRHFFTTATGHIGLATPGVKIGDEVAIPIGGDVPVVLRPCPEYDGKRRAYKLLCECYVQTPAVMSGELLEANWTLAEDIHLI